MSDVASKLISAKQHIEAGRWAQGKALLQQAVQKAPNDQNALVMLRFCLAHMGEHEQALYYAEKAAALFPKNPDILYNLTASLTTLNRADDAITAAERALAISPTHQSARLAIAALCFNRNRHLDAFEHARRGLNDHPGIPGFAMYASGALVQLGRADDAVRELRAVIGKLPPDLELFKQLASAHMYASSMEPSEVVAAHSALGRTLANLVPEVREPFTNDPDPDRVLRVGLFTGDARRHASWYFQFPFLEHYDRSRMHITVYSNSVHKDDHTRRIHEVAERGSSSWPVPAWRDLSRVEHEPSMRQIRADRIDVLVDTMGWTLGHGMPMLAMRAAPVQVEWLGYPLTTGAPTMDYRLTDSLLDPVSVQGQHSERLLHCDPCGFCWMPAPDAPTPERLPPSQREGSEYFGGVTFGSFTALQKLSEPLIRCWCRIVRETPGSRLLFKQGGLADEKTRAVTRQRFLVNGLDASRLVLEGPQGGGVTLIEHYNRVDICLDTWPYNGVTSTCECLYMGVPFVSRFWNTACGRYSKLFASMVGIEDLVAFDEDQYVSLAVKLAKDPDRLRELRTELPRRLAASPIRDARGFGERFERSIRGVWADWCRKVASRAA